MKGLNRAITSTVCLILLLGTFIIQPTTVNAYSYNEEKINMLSDNLFHNATYYNNELAFACANLCCEDVDDVSGYFPENHSEQYSWWFRKQAFHIGIGYKTIKTKGITKTLISMSFRGTGSTIEAILDFIKDYDHNYYEGQEALTAPFDFAVFAESKLNEFINKYSDIKKHPIVYLVSGYSLGGAAANLLGARLTKRNGGQCSDNVFVYTFGAIKAIANSSSIKDGYENIHNIYNYYDSWGPHGNHSTYGVSDPYYKFGNTHFCYFDADHFIFGYNSHDMGNYRAEVKNKKVEVSINRKAGLSNGGQWWTISNRNLNITSWNYLNIHGSGELSDGSLMGVEYPWYGYMDDINMIVIDDGITNIGSFEFNKANNFNNLYTIHIPSSVTSIGDFAFGGCDALSDVYFLGSREQWNEIIVDFDKNEPLKKAKIHCVTDYKSEEQNNGNEEQSNWSDTILDYGTCGRTLSYILYKTGAMYIYGQGRMETYSSATKVPWDNHRSYITDVYIGKSVKNISSYAFTNCTELNNVTISDSVDSIGKQTFKGCTSLVNISIPDSVTYISVQAFADCTKLASVNIPNAIKYISGWTFAGCKNLTHIEIPESVTGICDDSNDSLSGHDFPWGNAFLDCENLASITIPNSVRGIGDGTFGNCIKLSTVILPDSIETIEKRMFAGSGLKSITIPNSVHYIENYAFWGCNKLKCVTIPDSVKFIRDNAFDYCYNLKDVYYRGSEDDWQEITIGSSNKYLKNANIHYLSQESQWFDDNTNISIISSEGNGVSATLINNPCLETITSIVATYDIKLLNNYVSFQPDGEVTVNIPCSNNNAKVCRVESNGGFTEMNAKYETGNYIFTTNKLGTFIVYEEKNKDDETTQPSTDEPTESQVTATIPQPNTEPTVTIFEPTEPQVTATTPQPTTEPTVIIFEPTKPENNTPTDSEIIEPTQPSSGSFTKPMVSDPTQPSNEKPIEPIITEPTEVPIVAPLVTSKKPNPIKVTVKTKSIKLKKLKKKNLIVGTLTIKHAKGKLTYKIESGRKSIKKLISISKKGVITFKKWKKAKKGTYRLTARITANGNRIYNRKTITKTVKIKVK